LAFRNIELSIYALDNVCDEDWHRELRPLIYILRDNMEEWTDKDDGTKIYLNNEKETY
jgi:hypothetical protein